MRSWPAPFSRRRQYGASRFALLVLAAVTATHTSLSAQERPPADAAERARVAFTHALPQMDGQHLSATIVEVTYAPGGASKPHSHPCPVIGYVIEGSYRTQVKGEAEATYTAGQTFYEPPNGVHQVSANASTTQPVRFLAIFTCDTKAPLSRDVPPAASRGSR